MNEVFNIIAKRRSIRKYQDKPVERDKIIRIIEAARLAPSASNGQPWRFIVVSDKQLLLKIVKETLGIINQWAASAPVIIVGCSVRKNIITHYLGEVISGIKYHILDMGIALEHLVLEAEELELSTCWVGWFNERKIKRILNIPSLWRVISLITVGYKDPDFIPRTRRRYPLEKILIYKQ
ncbi:MAG: nitroreductase [Actinobacteria bacterium]|nr:nitroreductase [Actinomycetota bacterium]